LRAPRPSVGHGLEAVPVGLVHVAGRLAAGGRQGRKVFRLSFIENATVRAPAVSPTHVPCHWIWGQVTPQFVVFASLAISGLKTCPGQTGEPVRLNPVVTTVLPSTRHAPPRARCPYVPSIGALELQPPEHRAVDVLRLLIVPD
jgi:hypothetical protein